MPSEKYYSIYRQIIETISYADFLSIIDQIELTKDLSENEQTTLRTQYHKMMRERFNPSDCKSILQIKVPMANFKNEYRTFDRDGSERICVFAHEMNMPLMEYMMSIMHVSDFSIVTNPMKTPRNAEEVISRLNLTPIYISFHFFI